MSYSRKLLTTFIAVAVITNCVSVGVLYELSRNYLYDLYRARMLSIAASVATLTDGDALKTVQGRSDESSPAYAQLRQRLRLARDANRRSDTYMVRMFTVFRAPQDSSVILIGVDPEESLENATHPGDVYRGADVEGMDIGQMEVDDSYEQDEFGTFLRSRAPVRDSAGKVVGAVIVEASAKWVKARMKPLLWVGLLSLVGAIVLAVLAAILASRHASRPLVELHRAVTEIGAGKLETRVAVQSRDEFGSVAQAVNQMAAGLAERDRVKSAFARYVSHQVMTSILSSGKEVSLSGARRQISVLFCDIRGFSAISERLPPEKVVKLLNEYFEMMVEVVFRNKGTLDKFIGDGLMVIFGAPEDDPYQEEHALKTAVEMQRELKALAARWDTEGVQVRIGIGINSGPAIVGNIGSTRRMEYTAIGDTVNLASRLESSTKDLGVGILISEYTYNAVRGSFQLKPMGSIPVRGRVDTVQTYALEDVTALVTNGKA